MKKVLSFLFAIMMCGFVAAPLSAQNTLTVADGSTTNDYVPFYGYYLDANQHCQVIYPDSMLTDMQGSAITQMEFYLNSNPSFTSTITFKMGISSDATFASAAFDNTTTLTEVYVGSINIENNVMTVELDEPYTYNGGNLLLDFTNTNGNYIDGVSFYGISAIGASVSVYSSWGSATLRNFIPKTTFSYGVPPACSKPTNLVVSNISTTDATISWTGDDNTSSYNIQYMLSSESDWNNALTATANTETYTLTGLQPSSAYKVRVQAVCSDNTETNWSSVLSFMTACDAITQLPYSQDFEISPVNDFVPCWSRYASDQNHIVYLNTGEAWYWGSSILDFAYTPNCSTIAILPMFDSNIPLNTLQVEFDAQRTNTNGGTFAVGALTDIDDISTFEIIEVINISASNTWEHFVINCSGYTSGGQYLAFIVNNAGNGSRVLDNLVVNYIPDCPSPQKSSVTATNVDGHNATISWIDHDESHSSWTLYYKMSSEGANDWQSVTVNDTIYQLTNLEPETAYDVYVVTNCNGIPSDDATLTYTFTTAVACPAPTAVTASPVFINDATITWTSTASTFNVEYVVTGSSQGSGTMETVYDNTITLTGLTAETSYTVYVQADCGSEDGVSSWSSVTFTTLPNCPTPTQFNAINMTSTSTDLVWTPGYQETTWEVRYGPQNFNPDTSSVSEIVYDTTYQMQNLTANTTYDAYVRAICDDGSTSAWSDRLGFITPCAAATLPLTENFDSYPSWYSPDCWQKFENGNSGSYVSFGAYIYNEYPYSGDNALKFVAGSSSSGYALIRLPDLDTDDITSLQVKLMARGYSSNRPLIVGITPDFASVANMQIIGSFTDLTSTYTEKIVSLATYSNTTGYIVIGVPDGVDASATYYVDDVRVEVRPNCMYPTNFTAISLGETSVSLTWTEMGNSESWNVEYGPAGFTLGNGTLETVTDSTHYTVENLEESTAYDFYVQADCDGFGSDWVGPLTVITSQYLFGTSGSDTITTCGMALYDDGGLTGDYSTNCDFTLVIYPADPDAKLSLTGTADIENSWDYLYIYDGVGTSTLIANVTGLNQTVNVLSTTGPLTLKFTSDGSVVKSGFNLMAMCVTCFPPTDVTVTDVTTTSATVSWSGNATEYGVYVIGSDTTYYTTSDTTLALSDLTPSSTYRVRVQTLCSEDEVSSLTDAVSFNTSCDAISITADTPWFEDFEGYSSSQFVCWDVPVTYSASNGTFPMVYRGHSPSCHSGANSAEFKGSTNVLVLPPFTNDLSELRLSFWATAVPHPGTGAVEVGYMTDMNDVSSFVFLADAGTPGPRGNSGSGHGNYMGPFDFNGVTAPEGSRIALRYTNASDPTASWNLDDFTVELVPDCPSPMKTSVTASDIDGHNATISWTDNDASHTAWIVYYKASTESDWATESASTTTVDLTGLDPETTYDVYVVTDCGTTVDNPDATLTIHFTTLVACPAPQNVTVSNIGMTSATVTWFSNADSFTIEYGETGFTPGSGTTDISTTSTYDLTGLTAGTSYTVYVTADCGADGSSSATSVNFSTNLCEVADQCEYTFNLTDSYGDGWNNASITVQQNGVTVATVGLASGSTAIVPVTLCDNQPTTLIWNSGNYDGECSFTLTDPFGAELYASSDSPSGTLTSFTAYCATPTCLRPADITVSNIGASTADVSWTSLGTETAWNVEYKVSTDATWTVVPVTTNPYTLTNLTAATNYDVRVQADCGDGDVSDYRETSFNTAICEIADQCVYTFNLYDSYGDGWNGGTLTIQQNGITVATIGLSSGNSATETVNLCDNDSTSLVWTAGSYSDECTFTLIGPDGAELYSSPTMDNYTTYSFTTDCGGSGPVITDPTVTTTAATNITQTTATLNGTVNNPDNVTITPMGFEWKEATAIMYNVVNVTGATLTHNLSGLTAGTQYSYKAFITYNGMTYYGDEVTFTTLEQAVEPCDAPTGLTYSEVTGESIAISWNANANAEGYNIQYHPQGGSISSASVATNSYTITGLTQNTTYQIQVQANCGNGNLSGWSESITVTTTGIESHLSNSITLYPNPANDVVNVQCTMNNVQLDGVEVIDVYGKVVRTIVGANNYSPIRINVNGLANGMYFVRVTTDEGVATKTFIKK